MTGRIFFAGAALAAAIATDPEAQREVKRLGFDEVRKTEPIPHEGRQPIYMNVRISKLAPSNGTIVPAAVGAADAIWAGGGSPRAQIEAARAAKGGRLVYMPHQGAKERAKAARRALKVNG